LIPNITTFGDYADGIEPPCPTLPAAWEDRLVSISNANTRGLTGWCLEVHDLLNSKYVAGRAKDRRFYQAAARLGLCDAAVLRTRLAETELDLARREVAIDAINADHEDKRR